MSSTSLGTFPRSKRFNDPVESQVPGPGSYDIDITESVYKKGAMLEKAGRFIEVEQGPDTFGLYGRMSPGASKENKRPRTVSASGVHSRVQADDKQRLVAMHEKEVSRLQLKLVKLEAAKEELSRDRIESRSEVTSLKSEIRNLTSQLLKSSTSLTKHTTSLPLLQKKIEELTSSQNASLKRKESELISLNSQLHSLNSSLSETQCTLSDSTSLQQITSTALTTLTSTAKQLLDQEYSRISTTSLESIKLDSHAGQLRILRLEKQLFDRISQVSALVLFATEKEEELIFSDEIIKDFELEVEWREAVESTRQEEEHESRLREKEWRRRCRSYEREISGLREDLAQSSLELGLAQDWEEIYRHESDLELDFLQSQIEELEQELEMVEGEWSLATESEIPRLLEELDRLAQSSQLERETLWRTERSLRELMEREREERERREGEIEELTRRLVERERENDQVRADKKKIVGLLAVTRASECGLKEELDQANSALHRLQSLNLQSQHLNRTVDELARRNAAAEHDVAELSELNSQLISHENPNQKIRHLVNIREQLAQSKRSHLQTTSLLASARTENAALLEELAAYRSVSSQPYTTTTSNPNPNNASLSSFPAPPNRYKVQRPDLGDVFSASIITSNVGGNSTASGSQSASVNGTGLGLLGVGRGSVRRQVSIVEPHQQQKEEYQSSSQWRGGQASIIEEEDEDQNSSNNSYDQERYEQQEYDDEQQEGDEEGFESDETLEEMHRQQEITDRATTAVSAKLQVQGANGSGNSGLSSLPGSPGGGVRMQGKMKVSDLW